MPSAQEILDTVKQYNQHRFAQLLDEYDVSQQRAIRLLPLLFHTNVQMLPGYNGAEVASGIVDYTPDQASLRTAEHLYSRFKYSEDNLPETPAINSLLLQSCIITSEKILWVIYRRDLDAESVKKLNKKTAQINNWLGRQGVRMSYMLSREDEVAYNYYAKHDYQYHIDKSFFLDRFFTESVLIAGAQLSWWFDDCSEPLDNAELLSNCGVLGEPGLKEYISSSIWNLYNITNKPVSSYIYLCLIDDFISSGQQPFFSSLLKQRVLAADDIDEIDVDALYFDFLSDIVGDNLKNKLHVIKSIAKDTCTYHHKNIGMQNFMADNKNIEFRVLKKTLDNIFEHSIYLFRRIKTHLNLRGYTYSQLSTDLASISCGLLGRLNHHDRKIDLMYGVGVSLCDRVNYSQKLCGKKAAWLITHNDYILYAGASLVGLSCWAYVNQLVDHNTQVSITSHDHSVRQVDVLEVINVLERCVDLNSLYCVDIDGFIEPPMVTSSLLVIGHHVNDCDKLSLDHLVIYNTGEIYLYQYDDFNDVCDWCDRNQGQGIKVATFGRYAGMFRENDRKKLSTMDRVVVV